MGNIIGDKSCDVAEKAIAINPCNDTDFLAIGAQFEEEETMCDDMQDKNEYDPSMSLLRELYSHIVAYSLGELGKPLIHDRMLPGAHERTNRSGLECEKNAGYNALKRWVEEKSHEQLWNAVATTLESCK